MNRGYQANTTYITMYDIHANWAWGGRIFNTEYSRREVVSALLIPERKELVF